MPPPHSYWFTNWQILLICSINSCSLPENLHNITPQVAVASLILFLSWFYTRLSLGETLISYTSLDTVLMKRFLLIIKGLSNFSTSGNWTFFSWFLETSTFHPDDIISLVLYQFGWRGVLRHHFSVLIVFFPPVTCLNGFGHMNQGGPGRCVWRRSSRHPYISFSCPFRAVVCFPDLTKIRFWTTAALKCCHHVLVLIFFSFLSFLIVN